MIEPSGRRPSRIAVTICSSVQPPMPVSGSGVRLGAWTSKASSLIGLPPASYIPANGPSGVCGVWQLPQATMLFIR